MSINKSYFSDSLKIAKVTPLYRKGDMTDAINFWTISPISSIAKVFEKVTQQRMFPFLNKHKLLSPEQFGFLL